ncbi:hypothetical protein TL16_g01189, partial [Triparma laevis f. inornata]
MLLTFKSHLANIEPATARPPTNHKSRGAAKHAREQIGSSSSLSSSTLTSFPYSHVRPNLMQFALDQHGSRLVQHHLNNPSPVLLAQITSDCLPHLFTLSTDVFGNYIVQKIISLTALLLAPVSHFLVKNVMPLIKDQYGCRVVQAALIHVDLLRTIVHSIIEQGQLEAMLTHVNANHVLQKAVLLSTASIISPSLTPASIRRLSLDQYGCRVIQRMIESGWGEGVNWNIEECINHQYGNYIIQHLACYGDTVSKIKIFRSIMNLGLIPLCRQKYSSNVIEKLLVHGSQEQISCISSVLCTQSGGPANANYNCVKLVTDPFGNYVVRKAMDVDGGMVQDIMTRAIEVYRGNTYAKRVVAKIEKVREFVV